MNESNNLIAQHYLFIYLFTFVANFLETCKRMKKNKTKDTIVIEVFILFYF